MRGFLRGTRIAATLALFAWALVSTAAALPRPEAFTLNNGLQVVVIPDRRAPVTTHMIWYRVGGADEQAGKTGLAHYLEHLMFKGTDDIPQGEFSKIIARNGGQDNAFTSQDYTAYYQRIARDRLEMVMRMEADRMRDLVLEPQTALSERDVIVEERRQRVDSNPGAVLGEQMRARLWAGGPYGVPVIGWLEDIRSLTREDALEFYRKWYAPNNAVLVVAGDIDAAELRPLAERTYGRVAANPNLPARVWASPAPLTAAQRVSHSDPKVRQPSLSRLYRSVSSATAPNAEVDALTVAMEVLGGSQTSRLFRVLVEERKLAVSASAGADTGGLAGGVASVGASPAPGVSLETLEAAMDEVIARFLAEGPTAEETQRAQRQLAAAAIYARDSQEQLANIFGASLLQGETIEDVVTWADRIAAVTPQAARDAARQVLRIDQSVTGWLLPETDAEAGS